MIVIDEEEIFQFDKRIEFLCPYFQADAVPPYPYYRRDAKDYIYCCNDKCCNEVHINISACFNSFLAPTGALGVKMSSVRLSVCL